MHGVHVNLDSQRTRSANAACPPPRNPPSSDRSTLPHRSCWEISTHRAALLEEGLVQLDLYNALDEPGRRGGLRPSASSF